MLLTMDGQKHFSLKTEDEIQGPWFIELTPHDAEWLIQGRITFPLENKIKLEN